MAVGMAVGMVEQREMRKVAMKVVLMVI